MHVYVSLSIVYQIYRPWEKLAYFVSFMIIKFKYKCEKKLVTPMNDSSSIYI